MWKGSSVGGMDTIVFQVVSDVSFGHKREDKVGVAFGSVKTHSQETHYVGVVKSLHQETLIQQGAKLLFTGQIYNTLEG